MGEHHRAMGGISAVRSSVDQTHVVGVDIGSTDTASRCSLPPVLLKCVSAYGLQQRTGKGRDMRDDDESQTYRVVRPDNVGKVKTLRDHADTVIDIAERWSPVGVSSTKRSE